MEPTEGNDDELYPAAPLPAHERQWRHPSELGAQEWVTTEPPLTIGRGLSAATGAVGGLLALAVLWTMLPTHAGRSAGVGVRSTVATSLGTGPAPSSSFRDTDPTTSVRTNTTTTRPDPSTTSATTVVPTVASTSPPATNRPLPTYAVAQSTTLDPSAVAVAVNGSLVITTANAVAADNTVDLMLPDGGTERAHVLLVDQRSGLAVLAHDTSSTVESFTVASSLVPGDVLTFYGPDPVTARVQSDGSVDVDWGSNELREGTPVVNQRGELVALCSHDDTGASLVSLANLDELRRALSATAPTTVWMGVVVADSTGTSTGLAVGDVDPSGPAAAAGIVVGDVITAIGGIAVHDSATLGAALALHSPGDSVAVDLRRSTGDVTITVVLAKPKNSQ